MRPVLRSSVPAVGKSFTCGSSTLRPAPAKRTCVKSPLAFATLMLASSNFTLPVSQPEPASVHAAGMSMKRAARSRQRARSPESFAVARPDCGARASLIGSSSCTVSESVPAVVVNFAASRRSGLARKLPSALATRTSSGSESRRPLSASMNCVRRIVASASEPPLPFGL